MTGCCSGVIVLFFGPRVALFFAWLFTHWYRAFDSTLVAFLGFLFLPWTSLAWMYTYFHNFGQLSGGYIVLIILAGLVDLSVYGGSGRLGMKHRRS